MATIFDLRRKSLKLTSTRVRRDLKNFIEIIKEEMIAFNVATLHEESEDVDGNPIGYYSYATEVISGGKKKANEPFDLLDTGDFLDSIFVKVQSDSIFFGATDKKKKKVLKNLLSEDIFGLQEDDLNIIIETKLIPFFIDYFKKQLF